MDPSLQRIRELARQDSQQSKGAEDAQSCYDMLFQVLSISASYESALLRL